ncbi:hypothetical protein [Chengkuizengella sediminis]|uniref:hypothetical protein n=1 Tax=Chengkuizengella sediminis TaxID=1885917 RepID=UPI001389F518|nr:hypothetical protein [Chengkuizengella sediminis]NDI36280.1 hypothetical protein [Chengkuizengella sediminis]
MGKFDRTICDCCVCPMQSVMQQLVGRNDVAITTTAFSDVDTSSITTIDSADNFIVETSRGSYPICNVTAVGVQGGDFNLTLKPIQLDNKGECSCCEDPTTNKLKSLIKKTVEIEYDGDGSLFFETGIIEKVGEGIVTIENPSPSMSSLTHIAISTCHIGRVNPV